MEAQAPGAVANRAGMPGIRDLVVVAAGVLTGGFAAWAYYDARHGGF